MAAFRLLTLSLAAALAGLLAAQPAAAEPWRSRTADQGAVDAIGLATADDGTSYDTFNGLTLISVTCTNDAGKALRSPSVSLMAFARSRRPPDAITVTFTADGKAFKLAGRGFKDTPYYYQVRAAPAAFLTALAAASSLKASVSPGNLASTFDMAEAATVLGEELKKCKRK